LAIPFFWPCIREGSLVISALGKFPSVMSGCSGESVRVLHPTRRMDPMKQTSRRSERYFTILCPPFPFC